MKKVLIVLCLFISSVVCIAQTPAVAYAGLQTTTFSTNSSSLGLNETQSGANFHQITWTTSGTVTTCQVRVDSSADGISWNSGDIIANQTCTSNGNFTSASFTANFVRVTVSSLTGGGSITVVYTAYMNTPVGVGNCTYNSTTNTLKCTNILVGNGTPNSSTGTTTGLGAEYINTAGVFQLQTANTTNTTTPSWPVVAQSTCTSPPCTTGNAYVQSTPGSTIAVTMDNTCTGPNGSGVGAHYVQRSIITPGQYHDTGSSTAPTTGAITGRCLTSGTTTQSIVLEPQLAGGAGGSSTLTTNFHYIAPWGTFGVPTSAGTTVTPSITSANNVSMYLLDLSQGFTFTKATVSQQTASTNVGTICDFGLYTDGGSGTANLTFHNNYDCNATANGRVIKSGLNITLSPGTKYWTATCTSSLTATAPQFLGLAPVVGVNQLLNNGTQIRWAINTTDTCSAGVLPNTMTITNITASNSPSLVAIILEP